MSTRGSLDSRELRALRPCTHRPAGRTNQRADRQPSHDVPLGPNPEDKVQLVAGGPEGGKKLARLTAHRNLPREGRIVTVSRLGKASREPEAEGAVRYGGPRGSDLVEQRSEARARGVGGSIDGRDTRCVRALIDATRRPCHPASDGDAESQIARIAEGGAANRKQLFMATSIRECFDSGATPLPGRQQLSFR